MKRKLLRLMTLMGCFSTGILYGSVGVIAILSFFKLKKGGADESSFFVLLEGFLLGRVLIWLLIAGSLCFFIWRFYEAFKDPYHVGNDKNAILLRTGAAFSSGADAFMVISALQAMFAQQKAPITGEPVTQRSMVADLLKTDWGRWLVIVSAVVILIVALVLVFYGLSRRFTESIKETDFTKRQKYVVHVIAYFGYLSRGVILGIIGFFFLKAALERNSVYVVNTDKAFDFIGDHVGHVYFLLIAAGTISYGLYMFVLGLHYDIQANKNQ